MSKQTWNEQREVNCSEQKHLFIYFSEKYPLAFGRGMGSEQQGGTGNCGGGRSPGKDLHTSVRICPGESNSDRL
jgi:hypothetical protein